MDYRLEQLRFQLREDPSSRIFFKLGEHLRREGELDEAIEVLRTGLKQHPRYVAAWVSLGRALFDNNDAEGAQAALERGLELDPENPVAARILGEAAVRLGDWVTAVKALKLARGVSPQDDALDERIAFVEDRLAELGLLKKVAPANRDRPVAKPAADGTGGATAEEPFGVRSGGDTGTWNDTNDVFAAGWVAGAGQSAGEEVQVGTHEVVEAASDNGVTEASEAAATPPPLSYSDVATMVDAEEPAVAVFEPEVVIDEKTPTTEVRPEPEPVLEASSAPEPLPEPELPSEPEPPSETKNQPMPLPESWPASEAALDVGADGLPLATMTLARLAIDQGDLDLAERTLRGVLEREPGRHEASELLRTLTAGPPPTALSEDPQDAARAKAQALQRWLDAVRLASERLKT
jgi:tetratricopeptide (TPR) repeat protein